MSYSPFLITYAMETTFLLLLLGGIGHITPVGLAGLRQSLDRTSPKVSAIHGTLLLTAAELGLGSVGLVLILASADQYLHLPAMAVTFLTLGFIWHLMRARSLGVACGCGTGQGTASLAHVARAVGMVIGPLAYLAVGRGENTSVLLNAPLSLAPAAAVSGALLWILPSLFSDSPYGTSAVARSSGPYSELGP